MKRYLILVLCLLAGVARAQCNGNVDLAPVGVPSNVVEFRRGESLAEVPNGTGKILFDNVRLFPYRNNIPYFVQAILFSNGTSHQDGVCTTWPPIGTSLPGDAHFSLTIQDYPNYQSPSQGLVGAMTSDPVVLPRETIEVDGLQGLWNRAGDLQTNVNLQRTVIDIARGPLTTSTRGWQCASKLPRGTYREWTMSAQVSNGTHGTMTFVAPAENAQYLGPFDFATEFFTSSPGLFLVYIDTPQVLVEGSSVWQNVCTWRVVSQCGDLTQYGVKLAVDSTGRDVIEISNNGPANGGPGGFLPPGTQFTIPGCV